MADKMTPAEKRTGDKREGATPSRDRQTSEKLKRLEQSLYQEEASRPASAPVKAASSPERAPSESGDTLARGASPSNHTRLAALAIIVLAALCLWLAWKAFAPEDHGDPITTSLLALEKQNQLTVFSAQVAPVVSSSDSRYFGTLNAKQVAVIPARVDYTLDMTKMDASRMRWSPDKQTLSVRLPPITIGKPNLDEARAQYLREGIWITRDAQDKMTRDNTRLAEQEARSQAANPVLLNMARSAAKDAIRQNLTIPLSVAGYDDVQVIAEFDDENSKTPIGKDKTGP